ncbi:MAG: PASTA domain-containing protein, partial [Candidatus Marinimicrobia bacterium]|nr:PASTA domain-containing protein [Candidatus Neomarinimicrobiota bacterium]
HVAGKTGTAQKVIDGKYSNSKYYASFMGFFPSNDPVLLCGVVVDEPAFGLHHGGTAAAPAVKNTFSRIINTPDFNQQYPTVSKKLAENKVGIEEKNKTTNPQLSILHSNKGSKTKTIDNSKVKETVAHVDSEPVGDYDIIMPNLIGRHILNAEQRLHSYGLNVERNADRGKVSYQSPAPGTFLLEGATCRLEVSQ